MTTRKRYSIVCGCLLVFSFSDRADAQDPRFSVLHAFQPLTALPTPGAITPTADGNALMLSGRELFEITPSGALTVVLQFGDNDIPRSSFVRGGDGNYYATTFDRVIRLTPEGQIQTVFSASAWGLRRNVAGTIYGIETLNYPNQSFFSITTDGAVHRDLFRTAGTSYFDVAPDGTIYGLTAAGSGHSAVYRRAPDGTVTYVVSFALDVWEVGDLTVAADGTLFGLAQGATFGSCFAYRFDAMNGFAQLHDFATSCYQSTLVAGSDGNVYGAVGTSPHSVELFRLTPQGVYTQLHQFSDAYDIWDVALGDDGRLWGTTEYGGLYHGGSVFTVSPSGEFATILSAPRGRYEASTPSGPLVLGPDGALYGAAASGGLYGFGVVFRVTRNGEFTVLHTFTGGSDGAVPSALALGSDGWLYGTTGRTYNYLNPQQPIPSTVFAISTSGLYMRLGSSSDPASAWGRLTPAADGAMYGVLHSWIYSGGDGTSSIFRVTTDGQVSMVRTFSSQFELSTVVGGDGELYGTAYQPDALGGAVLFRSTLDGGITVVKDHFRVASLIQGTDGSVYGSTSDFGIGPSVFRVTTSGVVSIGTVPTNPADPCCTLFELSTQTLDGDLYGIGHVLLSDDSNDWQTKSAVRIRPDGATTVFHRFERLTTGVVGWFTDGRDGALYGVDNTGVFRARLVSATAAVNDTDGDGASDLVSYHPQNGTWAIRSSRTGTTTHLTWGLPSDVPVSGDFDGDGRPDVAMYRPARGQWLILTSSSDFTQSMSVTWGLAADIPVPADYNGDGVTDIAVYRPSTGMWFIRGQGSATFGVPGDIPVPGDYQDLGYAQFAVFRQGTWIVAGQNPVVFGIAGDIPVPGAYKGPGVTNIAVYRPTIGTWLIHGCNYDYCEASNDVVVNWGTTGDIPVPMDIDGDGLLELVVYRPRTGAWLFRNWATGNTMTAVFGSAGDLPIIPPWLRRGVAGDLEGDRRAELTLFRPSDGSWQSALSTSAFNLSLFPLWGASGDIPIEADFLGIGTDQRAVYRSGTWYIEGGPTLNWGTATDIPLAADFDGDGKADPTVYRNGVWLVLQSSSNYTTSLSFSWGMASDVPVAADYDHDGLADPAVFRDGAWLVLLSSTTYTQALNVAWGMAGDVPVAADYDADGQIDFAVYRPSDGSWLIQRSSDGFTRTEVFGGISGDVPVPADYDGDGRTDIAIYRSSTNTWYVLGQFTRTFGAPGDVPVMKRQ